MTVAVVSSVFGGYDEPVFVEQSVQCSYVMVTDGNCLVPAGWEHRQIEGGLHPRLMAKFAKCRPWTVAEAEFYVWMDGSIEPYWDLVESMLDCLTDADCGFYTHPDRSTITSEARVSAQMDKYRDQDVRGQVAHYLSKGHPDDWGLWAAGLFIVRDTPAIRRMGERWLEEIVRWTHQDQLSLPFVLREQGLRPVPLHGNLRGNPLFKIRRHADRT